VDNVGNVSKVGHAYAMRAWADLLPEGPTIDTMRPTIRCDVKGKIAATPSFEGRLQFLQRLRLCFLREDTSHELGRQRRFVLYGLGGSGKTQLVYKFVEDSADQCVSFDAVARGTPDSNF
jgi:hypothetical protein